MKFHRQFTSIILVLVFVLSLATGLLPVAASGSDTVNILACSDFQGPSGNNEGRQNVNAILAAMKADGITKADGLFACGDYDYDFTDTKSGINMLTQVLSGFVSKNKVFVQGNHDSANSAAGTNGLSESGNNDPTHQKYGVFVIHEDDYMWYNDDEDTVKRTTQKLIDYLNEKLAAGYDKPIFVLSHLGLHYTMRTYKEGDGKYAHYLVDALNEAGKKGLNLFFLYGHNHSNGWDDYLGGPAVYLKKGDTMLVGQGANAVKKEKTINFTYFNAGYTGYYSNVNGQDDSLSMTYITVKDSEVSITRYSKNGKHNMKNAGITNSYQGEFGYKPNTAVYESPQTIALTKLSDQTPVKDIVKIDKTLPVFKKITSLDDLVDGGRYLILRNNAPDSIMLPNVVTKAYTDGSERIGFDLLDTADFGDTLAFADVQDAAWTFTKTDGGWFIGDGESYLTRQQTDNKGIAAVFTDEGSVLQIKGESGGFTFYNGSGYSFNYNKRHLINFYTSDPCHFYIYEAVGYLVTAQSADVQKDGAKASYAKAGDTLTLTAKAAPDGYVFDKWEVTEGALTLSDPQNPTVTVTMPDEALAIKATYKTLPPTTSDSAPVAPSDPVDADHTTTVIIIVIAVALTLAIAATVTVIVIRKKSK